jgi:hypothetical protein
MSSFSFEAKVTFAVQQHPEPVHFVLCCVTHHVAVRQGILLVRFAHFCPFFSMLFRFVSDSKSEPSCLLCLPAVFG